MAILAFRRGASNRCQAFHHRFLGLALEAYRREEISRGKLKELATLVDLTADDLDCLVVDTGLDDDEPALARTQ
jgi:hypothetical protein